MSEWQSVDTLPREPTDDTWRILAYTTSDRRPVCELQRFQDYEEGPWYWSTPHGVSGRGYAFLWEAIKAWMPLPKPPEGC